jgi:hypothetical protein
MTMKLIRGGRKASVQPESANGEVQASIQPNQPAHLLVSESTPIITIDPSVEEVAALFRPRLYCVPED